MPPALILAAHAAVSGPNGQGLWDNFKASPWPGGTALPGKCPDTGDFRRDPRPKRRKPGWDILMVDFNTRRRVSADVSENGPRPWCGAT